jgi:transposase InsO family protein
MSFKTLNELIKKSGRPRSVKGDNAMAVRAWLEARRIGTHDIDSGSPWQNAYNERLNSRFRPTCLARWAFASVSETRTVSRQWLEEYNTSRPHGSLAGRSPVHPSAGWRGSNNDDEAELPNLNLRTKDRGLDNIIIRNLGHLEWAFKSKLCNFL